MSRIERTITCPFKPSDMVSALFIKLVLSKTKKYLLFLLIIFASLSYALGQSGRLFDSEEILEFTLRGDLRTAFRDKADDPQYHKAVLSYKVDQEEIDIPLKIKTRGNSRKNLSNCKYPPVFLNFAKSKTPKNSIFRGQDKTKLVTPCQGDQFVINEYLVYKLYNLIAGPNSFKARLVKVVYEDTVKNKPSEPLFGMLLEEAKQLAKRKSSKLVEIERLNPKSLDKETFLKLAVFHYMIANTDWGVEYQQNIKLLDDGTGRIPIPVPYDFDRAGIVRAPYAQPAPELKLSSTQERRYRGYCISDMKEFADVFRTFNELKQDFYAVYEGNPLLSERYIKQTLSYLDEFYKTINDPKRANLAFTYPCDPNGTGNVIIKGLNTD